MFLVVSILFSYTVLITHLEQAKMDILERRSYTTRPSLYLLGVFGLLLVLSVLLFTVLFCLFRFDVKFFSFGKERALTNVPGTIGPWSKNFSLPQWFK